MSDLPPPPPPGDPAPQPGSFPPPPPPSQPPPSQPPPPPPSQSQGFPPPPPGGGAPPFGAQPPGYGYGVPAGGYGPEAQYASFGARLGALLLDSLIVGLFSAPGLVYLLTGPKENYICDSDGTSNDFGSFLCERPTGGTIGVAVLLLILAFIAGVFYFGKTIGGTGQSIGMRAVSIKVVDMASGQPIGMGRAIGRYLFQSFISGAICLLGFLWMLWDPKKQTWHDKVVNSIVVKA